MSTWTLDPAHSEVYFKIKHLVISTVTGSFKKFGGTVESDKEDFSDAKVKFSAEVDSIDTNNEQRDGHLKSPDFFDAASHPKISFESTGVEKASGDDFTLTGNLTMKDVTKPVELTVNFGGVTKDMYGNTRAGFEISGKIDRQDFGLKTTMVTEAGGLVIGNDVKLMMNVELIKQA